MVEALALVLASIIVIAVVSTRLESTSQTETSTSISSAMSSYSSSSLTTSSQNTTSQSSCSPATNICGTFSSSPSGPLSVKSVLVTVGSDFSVTFGVELVNTGDSTVYVPDDFLGISVAASPNPIIQKVYPNSGPVCETISTARVDPGQNYTISGPVCDDGYTLQLVSPGTVGVTLNFTWNTSGATGVYPGDFPNSTTISAQFSFPVI